MVSAVRGTKRTYSKEAPSSKKSKITTSKASKSKKAAPESEPELSSEDDLDDSEDELDESEDDLDESEDELDEVSDKENAKESEDELDVDSSDGEDDNDKDEEDIDEKDSDKPIDPNKKTSKEQHAEQRKTLSERKLQRKSGIEVQKIKSLWERLRVKKPTPPKEVRDKYCDEIWDLSKDVIKDLVMKHDASRVVQTLIKYSSKERRDIVVKSLKGNFYELATSAYGKYLLVKLLHYGSKDARALIISELHGKLRKLMRHREGAYVVEDLFTLYATAEQKQQMIREFWGAEYAVFKESGKGKDVIEICAESAEKRSLISKNLSGTITASVEKGSTGFQILHAAMKEYTKIAEGKEVSEFIELLAEQFAELVHTPEGCEVACTLIAKANAKERKIIVRSLKAHAKKLIQNEYGNSVLITLFMTVDDTVLVGKTFSSELAEFVPELVKEKFSRRPFIYLLNGLDPRYFSPLIKKDLIKYEEFSKETSKKPQDQRRSELLKFFVPVFYKSIQDKITDVLVENMGSQFISELVLNNLIEDEQFDAQRTELLDAIIKAFEGDVLEEFHIINKPFSTRLLRTLIQGGHWNPAKKQIEKLNVKSVGADFAVALLKSIQNADRLQSWIQSPGSFVIVAIYETLKEESHKAFKDLNKSLKSQKKYIKETAEDNNKGAQLLLTLLEKK